MAVDQQTVGWVEYNDGYIYRLDIKTLSCASTNFQPDPELGNFGMSFVFQPTTGIDTLYVAGSPIVGSGPSTLGTIAFPSLTAALVRRELFERAGMLDERFESYLEDVDFGLRCAARHYHGVYVPRAVAYHAGSATLGAWHKATVRRISRNQVLLVKKHFRGAPRLPIVAGQLLWGMLALRHGAGCAWIRGKLDGLRYSSAEPAGEWAQIRTVIESSEAEIRDLQMATGFDLYWKLYFALVGTRA